MNIFCFVILFILSIKLPSKSGKTNNQLSIVILFWKLSKHIHTI